MVSFPIVNVANMAIGYGRPLSLKSLTDRHSGRTQSCSAQELLGELGGEIAYFKLARCAQPCLNAFDEQKKA